MNCPPCSTNDSQTEKERAGFFLLLGMRVLQAVTSSGKLFHSAVPQTLRLPFFFIQALKIKTTTTTTRSQLAEE